MSKFLCECDIVEFDPQIYPYNLWVGKNLDYETVSKRFYALCEGDVLSEISPQMWNFNITNKNVSVYPVVDKNTMCIGVLVRIHRVSSLKASTITHEASHITDFFAERMGFTDFSYNGGEPRAYLAGWVADCIDKVKRGKYGKSTK